MECRIHAQEQFARVRLLWRTSQFLARFQIVVDGLLEGGAQFADAFAVEANDVTNARNVADECRVFVAVLDAGNIAFMGHHVHRCYHFMIAILKFVC